MEMLATPTAVVDALKGVTAVAELTGKSPQAVWNWCDREKFPADTFLIITEALRDRGLAAPPSLWGIKEPEQVAG